MAPIRPHDPQDDVARRLLDLIDAIDDRAPRAERASEPTIARDAASLRERAVHRLAEVAAEHASTALTPRCPSCQTSDARKLDEPSRIAFVDYFQCEHCHHVWTADRGTHRILRHVTPMPV
jgi:hypothetical protein